METIDRSAVFAEIKQKNREMRTYVFAVKYCRMDSTIGIKDRVMKVYVGNDNAIVNRTVNLCDVTTGKAFRIGLDFWISYNGKIINHDR